jgi:hypothetical protein
MKLATAWPLSSLQPENGKYRIVPVGNNASETDIAMTVTQLNALAEELLKKRLIQGQYPSSSDGRAIMRAYLDLRASIKTLQEAEYGKSELDLGFCKTKFDNTSSVTPVCYAISVVVAVAFVGTAVAFSAWGASVYHNTAFDASAFFGIPSVDVFWSIYCALILGLVFGFLDNFGLFFGMSALDASFYSFGANVSASLLGRFRGVPKEQAEQVEMLNELHEMTSDLMSGLGNTFSDLLGVALGTAALEIAKSGLGVEPTFWLLDLVAIVLGCLLGAFLPVLLKHSEIISKNPSTQTRLKLVSQILIVGIFVAVFLAGFPYKEAHIASVVVLCLIIAFLVVMITYGMCAGEAARNKLIGGLDSLVGRQKEKGDPV